MILLYSIFSALLVGIGIAGYAIGRHDRRREAKRWQVEAGMWARMYLANVPDLRLERERKKGTVGRG